SNPLSGPRIRVKPPGPRTRALLKRSGDELTPFPPIWGIPVIRADGPWIEDVDGNVYLDFISGKTVANIGHRHPEIVRILKEQIDRVILGATENRFSLEEKLSALTPGKYQKKVLFGTSGSDCVDGALKLAWWATNRPYILCVAGAYHGQTHGALSASSAFSRLVRGFHPAGELVKIPPPYCYRCPFELEYPACGVQCLDYVESTMFTSYCPPDEVAAVIVEPIFGDMGWVVPPPEYFTGLKRICDRYGILLIADEVQTGLGRTGKWFALEHFGIEPDITCLGKPLASGIPLSALVARKDLLVSPQRPQFGSFHQSFTLEANALGCAAALATIRVLEQEKLLENCRNQGAYLMQRLERMKEIHPLIGDVRGKGLLCTAEIVRNRETREPAAAAAQRICARCLENGLYTMVMGAFSAACIRIAPPLNCTREIIDTGLRILEQAMTQSEQESEQEM
ncbi:MAG: aspartate aminotransferase family protein, partial [Spirochaetales bacterium]|nr:aspartate aminotransferase family protein [Spirochaetales bacterium]